MIEINKCIVCGNKELKLAYKSTFDSSNWEDAVDYFLANRKKSVYGNILSCTECEFMFTSPQFDTSDYARIYSNVNKTDYVCHTISNTNRYKKLKKHVEKYAGHGKLLDLGCSDGGFIHQMKNFSCTGFEISTKSDFISNTNKIISGDFTDYSYYISKDNKNLFDIVTAWDVLEHINNLDEYMKAIKRILKPNGYFICSLPNANSVSSKIFGSKWNCILLEHLWYFNESNFKKYAEKYGFYQICNRGFSYDTSMSELVDRLYQTYNIPRILWAKLLPNIQISLPIGLMLVVLKNN